MGHTKGYICQKLWDILSKTGINNEKGKGLFSKNYGIYSQIYGIYGAKLYGIYYGI